MKFFVSVLFAIVGAVDVFAIGLSYGLKQMRLRFRYNVLISLVAGIGTFLAMIFGNEINRFLTPRLGNLLGGCILFLLGGKLLWDCYRSKAAKKSFYEKLREDPDAIDLNHSGTIEPPEILVLALVLALNNIGLGIGASLAELNVFIVSVLSVLCSMACLEIGYRMGETCKKKISFQYADEVSAFLIISLGVYILLCT